MAKKHTKGEKIEGADGFSYYKGIEDENEGEEEDEDNV